MTAPIDFYFDFASPYGYIASQQIDKIAERYERSVTWRAIVLDANFQSLERIRIPNNIMRSDYIRRDAERLATFYGVEYRTPSNLGAHTEQAARIFHWVHDRQPLRGRDFASRVMKAYFVDDQNIASEEVLEAISTEMGLSAEDFAEASANPASRSRLKAEVDMAEARGVFGSPFFIVEGERFWGNDRLPQLERWLATGPY
ncbi:2-hydroxychromene-2-carboxylate isomerase [Paucibacter sp. B2R-40]|jgi:2-hydroxychromene-2-carboxylate isomerase|uniref:2-hydroxychromene-2-carboxylate isomerase n=1 Tax=Paucibacter sp. B2R-40 TaxID=2893554 RepID=UPI0021E4B41C|nr:2-hydroxychromene-2-carboxylate isomerase [Paucibacter sp. B2R-40]MCV2354615.1 2-hydroxychromene-2-carboxylate isomerase [Paucibacter sp. B2R-40]